MLPQQQKTNKQIKISDAGFEKILHCLVRIFLLFTIFLSTIIEAHEVVRDGLLEVYAVVAAVFVLHCEADAFVGVIYGYGERILC